MLKNPSSFFFVLYLKYTFVTFFRSFRLRFLLFFFPERWKIVPEMGTIAKSNRIFRGRTLGTSGKNKLHRMIHEFLEWVSFFIFSAFLYFQHFYYSKDICTKEMSKFILLFTYLDKKLYVSKCNISFITKFELLVRFKWMTLENIARIFYVKHFITNDLK